MSRDINFNAESVRVLESRGAHGTVHLEVEEADIDQILTKEIPVEDVIAIIGQDTILDSIGHDEVVDHFNIEEAD